MREFDPPPYQPAALAITEVVVPRRKDQIRKNTVVQRGPEQGGTIVVAALGIGIIGTILVVILVIAAILFFLRRR